MFYGIKKSAVVSPHRWGKQEADGASTDGFITIACLQQPLPLGVAARQLNPSSHHASASRRAGAGLSSHSARRFYRFRISLWEVSQVGYPP